MSPTFNPTNYNQYDDPNNAHFEAIYELRQLTTENIQKITANIVDFTQILSMVIETSYVQTSTSNDLKTNDFWVKIEQLDINQEYFSKTLALNNTPIMMHQRCNTITYKSARLLLFSSTFNSIRL
eukprot:497796_1